VTQGTRAVASSRSSQQRLAPRLTWTSRDGAVLVSSGFAARKACPGESWLRRNQQVCGGRAQNHDQDLEGAISPRCRVTVFSATTDFRLCVISDRSWGASLAELVVDACPVVRTT